MESLSKKEQIEAAGHELFWKYGFKRVSVADICEKAGVSRKTYYSYYSNKQELALALLHKLFEEWTIEADKVFQSDLSFAEKIKKGMNYKVQMSRTWSKEFLDELLHTPVLSDYMNEQIRISFEKTRNFFLQAQKEGEVNPDLNIDYVMLILQKYTEWMDDPIFLRFFPTVEELVKQLSYSFMYGLFPVKEK